jgi:hypothetical protein
MRSMTGHRRGMMRLRLGISTLALVAVGALLGAPAVSARKVAPEVPLEAIWKATVHGTTADPAIRGTARYTMVAVTPLYRYFDVELSHADKYLGRRLAVYLGGGFVGWMRVGSLGRAHLTRRGSGGLVPTLPSPSPRVTIKTRGGVHVATGRLREIS